MSLPNARWTKIAFSDLQNVSQFLIAQDKPIAARSAIKKILSSIDHIINFPESGRKGRVKGTSEFVITTTPFIIVYRKKNEAIEILAILHHARKWS